MENSEDQKVQLAAEPSIERRFGFGRDRAPFSSQTVKICAAGTVVALTTVMLMRSPDPLDSSKGPGVKPPSTDEMSKSIDGRTFESYSATRENERIQQNKRKLPKIVVRLPGLQKIDRTSSAQIPPGSLVKAILITGASNGPVRAEVQDALTIRGETFIPQGATLLGTGQSTEDRLMVTFTKMILKDGTIQKIHGQAADVEDKTVGLHGSRVGRYAMKYASAVGLNFVGGMAEGLQEREIVGQTVVTKPDAKNALLNGASRAAIEMGTQEMSGLRNQQPVIQIDAGKEILVMFDGES